MQLNIVHGMASQHHKRYIAQAMSKECCQVTSQQTVEASNFGGYAGLTPRFIISITFHCFTPPRVVHFNPFDRQGTIDIQCTIVLRLNVYLCFVYETEYTFM